ncbi:hypothetical protein MKW98_022938 [Papaver atlanticum]|uniref:KEN domain-containing protein n=1 Tax=Papaver atlanticum TaxID=357466 RepID=A0AAD4TL84_9MAGN|nr:hypothetical protein MKW98_022938 [Papaver atlanticum]
MDLHHSSSVESRVDQAVSIESQLKHEGQEAVWNGIFDNKPVTVMPKFNQDAIERTLITPRHILSRIIDTEDKKYTLFERYICTVEELLLVKAKLLRLDDLQCKLDEKERELLEEFAFADPSGRPNSKGVDLLRDVIEGLWEIYYHKRIHGNLTTKNIVLCIGQGKLIWKLTRIAGRVINEDGKTVFYLTSYYISFSEVMAACFVRKGVNKDKIREVEELWNHINKPSAGLQKQKWKDIVAKTEEHFRADPRSLFKNPLFWTPDMCIAFISHCRMFIDLCGKWQYDSSEAFRFTNAIKRIHILRKTPEGKLVRDWSLSLPEVMKLEVSQAGYRTSETPELIRYVRNGYFHLEDKDEDFKKAVGAPPDEYYEYFRNLFPDFLLDTHRVCQYYFSRVQAEVRFRYQFEKYL